MPLVDVVGPTGDQRLPAVKVSPLPDTADATAQKQHPKHISEPILQEIQQTRRYIRLAHSFPVGACSYFAQSL